MLRRSVTGAPHRLQELESGSHSSFDSQNGVITRSDRAFPLPRQSASICFQLNGHSEVPRSRPALSVEGGANTFDSYGARDQARSPCY